MANKPTEKPATPAYQALTKYLTFPTNDQEQWWQRTGALLGRMLESTGYPVPQQYQYLTFFLKQVVPSLGPYPARFRSSVTVSGQPIELSVNYQQHGDTQPIVRIGCEALDSYSGTERDPFNQLPASAVISNLSRLGLDGFDPQLFSYFSLRHTINPEEKAQLQGPLAGRVLIKSQHGFGFDLKDGNVLAKGYSFPGLKTITSGQSMSALVTESITHIRPGKTDTDEPTCIDSWNMIDSYLAEVNGYSNVHLWSWDYVDPAKSRLKIYAASTELSWRKLEEAWTLNRRAAHHPANAQGLQYLRQLWDFMQLGDAERVLPADRPAHVKQNEPFLLWNYEMTPGEPIPIAKPYLSLHGVNDLACVRNLARFFDIVGWKDLAGTYPDTVKAYYPEYDLETTSHLVMWVSFSYSEKKGVYLSVYYHSSADALVYYPGGDSKV
ncbi:aromatic prenyltransferase [Aspergillus aurantiobrunneus]